MNVLKQRITKSGKADKDTEAKMQTVAQQIADIVSDAKTASVETLALVVVQVAEQKIVDFNLVDLVTEEAAVAQLTDMVNAGLRANWGFHDNGS